MSKFMTLNSEGPATLGAVLEAVTELSTLGEAKILELVTAGKIAEVFPFKPAKARLPADTQSEAQLVEASAMPLSRKQRDALIQVSLPAAGGMRRRKGTPKR